MATDVEFQLTTFGQLTELHTRVKELIRKVGPSSFEEVDMTELTELLGKIAELQENFAPEEVEVSAEQAQDGSPAIGWVIMGGLSVGLTRRIEDGKLLVGLENIGSDAPLPVLIHSVNNGRDIWEGEVE